MAETCSIPGSGSNDYGSSGSGSGSCFEPYTMVSFGSKSLYLIFCVLFRRYRYIYISNRDSLYLLCVVQECNATEIHCDAGMDSEGCWYGNYCINQVLNIPSSSFIAFALCWTIWRLSNFPLGIKIHQMWPILFKMQWLSARSNLETQVAFEE